MVTLGEAQITTIGDPGLGTLRENGQHNRFVDIVLRVFLYIFAVPDTFV